MFGLLDSVKQALDLKRNQDEENKIHNDDYGEKATYSTVISQRTVWTNFWLFLVLDEILEDQRKQGRDKSTPHNIKSFKHLRPQSHNLSNSQSHSLLSSVKTSPVIQPLSVAGLSTASYAQLALHPQLFTHLSASNGQRHAGASSKDRDDHSAMLEREHELVNREKLHRLRQEAVEKKDVSEIHKDPGQRTVKSENDPYLKSEEIDETGGFHGTEKVVIGRKALKKHKSKWERDNLKGMLH